MTESIRVKAAEMAKVIEYENYRAEMASEEGVQSDSSGDFKYFQLYHLL